MHVLTALREHLVLGALCACAFFTPTHTRADEEQPEQTAPIATKQVLREIIVEGNRQIKTEVIHRMLPYQVGEPFDIEKTPQAINNLYALGYFRQVRLETEEVGEDLIDLYVVVEEKQLLSTVTFTGNKAIKAKKLREDLGVAKTDTVDEEWVERAKHIIQAAYKEEGYHYAHIEGKLAFDEATPDKASVMFDITEGPRSRVIRVFFTGNKHLPDWKLASIIFTREEWLLSFMDKSGKYSQEELAKDKARIERLYRDNGYMTAKVIDAPVTFSEDKKEITITFSIEEGEQYTIGRLAAPGDDIFLESDLLPHVLLKKGEPYSLEKLVRTLEKLRSLWGDKGYINADVYPQIIPNEETKIVDITFFVERGNLVHVRRIDITGNQTTRDKVIRRRIDIEEGDLLTSKKIEKSEDAVNALGFFERGGVNFLTHRVTDELVDLEMNVKETLTGQINFQGTYGSGEDSNKRSVKGRISINQRNFMGKGWDIGAQAQAQLARHGSRYFEGHFINPHIFDSNVLWHLNGYHRIQAFDEWLNVERKPTIRESGGITGFGFYLTPIDKHLQFDVNVGWEYLDARKVVALPPFERSLQPLLDDLFTSDSLQWFEFSLFKDTRNHYVYPNRGYKVLGTLKLALPELNSHYAFVKGELEASYYTRLIGEDALVLMLHGKAGFVQELDSRSIPYKELYHIGGQTSVRGFRFGEIGPAFNDTDPIGGRFMLQFNSELIFPLVPDYSIRGHVFYDAGAGWDGPRDTVSRKSLVTRNDFNLRHSVGFGINLLAPMAMKLDWGYKLDRNKERGESPHEFHLSANYAF